MTEAENQQDWLTPGERAMFMSALNRSTLRRDMLGPDRIEKSKMLEAVMHFDDMERRVNEMSIYYHGTKFCFQHPKVGETIIVQDNRGKVMVRKVSKRKTIDGRSFRHFKRWWRIPEGGGMPSGGDDAENKERL